MAGHLVATLDVLAVTASSGAVLGYDMVCCLHMFCLVVRLMVLCLFLDWTSEVKTCFQQWDAESSGASVSTYDLALEVVTIPSTKLSHPVTSRSTLELVSAPQPDAAEARPSECDSPGIGTLLPASDVFESPEIAHQHVHSVQQPPPVCWQAQARCDSQPV